MSEPCVPTLEMLWEVHDAADVLESRFGFSDGADEAGQWVVAILEEYWGVQVDACDRIVMSDHNALAWVDTASGRMLLKWSTTSDRFPRLAALARLTAWLDARGLPVSLPIASVDGRRQVEVGGTSLSFQREIDGNLLDTTKSAHVRAAGVALARLHDALADYPEEVPGLLAPSAPLKTRITGWLGACPQHVPVAGRDCLRRLVADTQFDPLPVQLVHGDFRSANVLCDDFGVAAVIDFEEARLDHQIVELARSAVMLGTRFRGWSPVSAAVRADFLSGYQSQHRLIPAEARWWDILVLWFSLALIPAGEDATGWGSAALRQLKAPRGTP